MLKVFECVRIDWNRRVIEEHVTVGTDAKQVIPSVAAVMRTAKRPDVMCLAVGTVANDELRAAYLAGVVV